MSPEDRSVPIVSVIMGAYNEERSIRSAIQSIIDQTYFDWELIVVDDASVDRTAAIVDEFCKIDGRIKLIINQTNLGVAASVNRAIKIAKGKYIARMDADDVSYPDRLQIEKDFLDCNEGIAVIGGNADLVDERGVRLGTTKWPTDHDSIAVMMRRSNSLVNPSVMYRKEFIEVMGGYDESLRRCEDYDLWLRGVQKYKYANLSQPLICYRVQRSKPIVTDLYAFYVRMLNARRDGELLSGTWWATVTLGINVLRKFGYKQRMYRARS